MATPDPTLPAHDADPQNEPGAPAEAPSVSPRVTVLFSRTSITADWDDSCESLLDLADQHGVDISAGCRYGDCGTCLTELLDGSVTYNHVTGIEPDPGYCLPCSCRPRTNITIDA